MLLFHRKAHFEATDQFYPSWLEPVGSRRHKPLQLIRKLNSCWSHEVKTIRIHADLMSLSKQNQEETCVNSKTSRGSVALEASSSTCSWKSTLFLENMKWCLKSRLRRPLSSPWRSLWSERKAFIICWDWDVNPCCLWPKSGAPSLSFHCGKWLSPLHPMCEKHLNLFL